jgi:hypothetical protein
MLEELKQVLSGATLRTIAGIVDVGEAILATFGDPDGGATAQVADDKSDVWVTGQCATDGVPTGKQVARLFIPMNMLFRLPKAGESYIELRGKDAAGPGKPYAIYGDCGAANQVPGWDDGTNLDASNVGVFAAEGIHVESTGDRVRIVANSGGAKAVIEMQQGGSIVITPASGQTIQLGGTSHKAVLDTLLSDLSTALGFIPAAAAPAWPGVTNSVSWAAFLTKLTSGAYQSQVVENG